MRFLTRLNHHLFRPIFFVVSCLFITSLAMETANAKENPVKIYIDIQGKTITATLKSGSAAAEDFAKLLPLTLTLSDYASTEKVADLPKRLSTQGEPAGTSAKAGDITYYSPWGNLAIFHKSFGYAGGLITLGSLDSGLDLMRKSGSFPVTIRLADD